MTTGLVLAADIGGTQMRAALVDQEGYVVARCSAESAPTPEDDRFHSMIQCSRNTPSGGVQIDTEPAPRHPSAVSEL